MKMILKNEYIILILMFALHIFADFHLQGILANLKQKEWWEKELEKYAHLLFFVEYRHDWVPSLLAHSFEWSFFIMLPFLFIEIPVWAYVILLILNTGVHFVIDHMKCNLHMINLCLDQLCHIAQILLTWLLTWYILSEIIF